MANSPQPHATAQELATTYRISVDTVRRKAAGGEWPCGRIGRLYRFSTAQQEQIAQILAAGRRPAYDGKRIAAALRQLSERGTRLEL